MSEGTPRGTTGSKIAVAAIIVAGIVTLACIAGTVLIVVTFLMNAPW